MVEAIHDSQDATELAEAISVVLTHSVCTFGAHTFPDRQLNKDFVRRVGQAFRDRVEDLAAQNGDHAQVIKLVVDVAFD